MSQRDEHGNTPMKLMIRHLPLAALAVLDVGFVNKQPEVFSCVFPLLFKRCRTKTIASKKLGDRSVLRVTYNWKYIEEDFADRQLKPDVETLPLWLMMKENRAELLAHPVGLH